MSTRGAVRDPLSARNIRDRAASPRFPEAPLDYRSGPDRSPLGPPPHDTIYSSVSVQYGADFDPGRADTKPAATTTVAQAQGNDDFAPATRRVRLQARHQRQAFERARQRSRPHLDDSEYHEDEADTVPVAAPPVSPRRLRLLPGARRKAEHSAARHSAARHPAARHSVARAFGHAGSAGCPPCHRGLFALTLLLTILSIPLVYSASTAIALDHYSTTDYFLKRQASFVAAGLILLLGISRLPARHLRAFVWTLFALTVLGLLATKFTPLGLTLGGVRRWVKFGPLPLQFSELAKIALIGVLADYWSGVGCAARSSSARWWVSFALALPVVALVFVQPHLSAAALLFLLPFCIAFFASVPTRQLASAALVLMLLAGASTTLMKPYQRDRLKTQFGSHQTDARGSQYQALQGMRALERGGLLGAGPGGGLFKQGHLPAPHTDFILAVTGEEWGLLGMLGLLIAYGLVIFFCFQTAHAAGKSFEALLCAGIGMLLAIQLICNVSVVTGLLPVTGMPLPLLSYGGSGLLCTLLGLGLVLSVSRQASASAEAPESEAVREAVEDYEERVLRPSDLRRQPYLV